MVESCAILCKKFRKLERKHLRKSAKCEKTRKMRKSVKLKLKRDSAKTIEKSTVFKKLLKCAKNDKL